MYLADSLSSILSSVTRIYTTHTGYAVNTVTHTSNNGIVTSTQESYTVYTNKADVITHNNKHTVDYTV